MATIISSHDAKILNPAPAEDPRTYNCRRPEMPYQVKCIMYKATVTAPAKPVGHNHLLTEGPFKTSYYSHTHSFQAKSCKNDTELSKCIYRIFRSATNNIK